jgi:chaperonin cofactor prefoldin
MKELPSNVLNEISQLIAQEESWLNQLKNCETELDDLQEVLEVYSKHAANTDEEKKIGHYDNLFQHYRVDLIKDLKHHVRINLQDLQKLVIRSPQKYYHSYLTRLEEHEAQISEFFSYYEKMKTEFRESVSYQRLRTAS